MTQAAEHAVDQALIDQKLRYDMGRDMAFFGKMMFPRELSKPVPDFHELIYRLYLDPCQYKCVIAPRHHAKSTTSTFVNPMHALSYKDPDEPLFILIISEAQHQSARFVGNIRNTLRFNGVYRYYFGDMLVGKGTKDTETELILNNNTCILALGTGQRVRGLQYMGSRPNRIICDDFESEHNTNTLEARVANKRWLSAAVENTLAENGQMLVTGTIVHPDAYLVDVQNDPAWKVLKFDAEVDALGRSGRGISLWPTVWPWEKLMAKKASLEARGQGYLYWQEFRNTPSDPSEQGFKEQNMCFWSGSIDLDDSGRAWISITWLKEDGESRRFDPPLRKPVNTYLGVDLNSKDHGDYGVILPMALDADENYYFDDYERGRMDTDVVIEHLFDFYKRYHPELVVIETVGYQEQMKRSFIQRCEARGVYIPVKGVDSKKKKSLRHNEMVPDHKKHRIWIKTSHTIAEAEMKGHPKPPSDDWLDAAWNTRQYATKPDVVTPKQLGASMARDARTRRLAESQRRQMNFKLL